MTVLEPVRPPQPRIQAQPPAPKTVLVRPRVSEDDGLRALSHREIEVLALVACGGSLSN